MKPAHLAHLGRSATQSTPISDRHRHTTGKYGSIIALLMLFTVGSACADLKAESDVQRGRYLIQVSGCNDCHTPGYMETDGKVDEKFWLTGSQLGWRGPWGTTYASNLRLVVQNLTEQQWLSHARGPWRPPMPWFNLRKMRDEDLMAIFRYIRHLGPSGAPAPLYLPPDQMPKMPYAQFPGAVP